MLRVKAAQSVCVPSSPEQIQSGLLRLINSYESRVRCKTSNVYPHDFSRTTRIFILSSSVNFHSREISRFDYEKFRECRARRFINVKSNVASARLPPVSQVRLSTTVTSRQNTYWREETCLYIFLFVVLHATPRGKGRVVARTRCFLAT